MKRRASVFIILTIVFCFGLIAPAAADSGMLIISTSNEPIAKWDWEGKGGSGANYRLIWSDKTAETFLSGVNPAVKEELQAELAKLDFEKKVAIVAYMGEMPTAGYQVEIAQVAIADQTVMVDVGMQIPTGEMVAQVQSYPYDIVTLARKDIPAGEIRYRITNQNGQVLGDRRTTVNQAVTQTPTNQTQKPAQKPVVQKPAQKSVAKDQLYTVKTGDTLWSLAQKFDTTIETILQLNPKVTADEIFVGQVLKVKGPVLLPAPTAKNGIHVVQTGESLWSIATQYKTTIEKLMEWNKLSQDTIWAGQQLRIKA